MAQCKCSISLTPSIVQLAADDDAGPVQAWEAVAGFAHGWHD